MSHILPNTASCGKRYLPLLVSPSAYSAAMRDLYENMRNAASKLVEIAH